MPIALGLGPNAVAETGVEHALAAEVTGRTIGDPAAPGLWYVLGAGDGSQGWTRLGGLMEHLTGAGADTGPGASWRPGRPG